MKVCQYCGWNDGEHADGCENENAEPLPVRPESDGSVCSNCVYWEGIEELGSYIEGTCFAMMRVTGYAETCDEFSPND